MRKKDWQFVIFLNIWFRHIRLFAWLFLILIDRKFAGECDYESRNLPRYLLWDFWYFVMYYIYVHVRAIPTYRVYWRYDILILLLLFVGLKLATVFDVMQLNPLPKVICSLQAWKGDDDKSSVVENEVFVLKQVRLTWKKSRWMYTHITVVLQSIKLESSTFVVQCVQCYGRPKCLYFACTEAGVPYTLAKLAICYCILHFGY